MVWYTARRWRLLVRLGRRIGFCGIHCGCCPAGSLARAHLWRLGCGLHAGAGTASGVIQSQFNQPLIKSLPARSQLRPVLGFGVHEDCRLAVPHASPRYTCLPCPPPHPRRGSSNSFMVLTAAPGAQKRTTPPAAERANLPRSEKARACSVNWSGVPLKTQRNPTACPCSPPNKSRPHRLTRSARGVYSPRSQSVRSGLVVARNACNIAGRLVFSDPYFTTLTACYPPPHVPGALPRGPHSPGQDICVTRTGRHSPMSFCRLKMSIPARKDHSAKVRRNVCGWQCGTLARVPSRFSRSPAPRL